MRFRVLGSVELLEADGSARAIGSRNQRALLASLLARPGEVVSVDTIVDALWDGEPPPSAVATVRSYVSRLRRSVGASLAARGAGYALDVDPSEVDALEFERLLRAADRTSSGERVEQLESALALWVGPAFADLADLATVRGEARRLDELRSAAREALAAALLEAGRVSEAVAAAEHLVAAEPLREGAWAVLVDGLARASRQADALRAFQRANEALGRAGLEPTARLWAIEQRVLADDGPPDRPPSGSSMPIAPVARVSSIPLVPSSFIGREADCREVTALLDESRVVSLVGPGGVGKTRLALELARARTADGPHQAHLVDLAALDESSAVPDVVAAALGLPPSEGSTLDALQRAGALDALLVLDNAEHVIDGVAATVEALTSGGDQIRILATSRERLGVDGEHVWHVSPLAADGEEAPGPRLFVDRARAVGATIDADVSDPHVLRIVRRLDGLPLALEMAAARLSTVSLDELADALDEKVDQLQSPRRRSSERHRSLTAVLEWSEALLQPDEATFLAELSVFAGPVTVDDLVGVLGRDDAGDAARRLVERSLVTIDPTGKPTRLHLLQIVRAHAARRLAEAGRTDEVARRHAEWFTEVAQRADRALRTESEGEADARIRSIFGELRAAFRWSRQHDLMLAGQLVAALHHYAYSRLAAEPLQWAESLVDVVPAAAPFTPVLLASSATSSINRGDLAKAARLAERAVELAADDPNALPALEAMGDTATYGGRLDVAEATYRTMVRLGSEADDPYYLAIGETSVALVASYRSDEHVTFEPTQPSASPTIAGWVAYTRGELAAATDPEEAFLLYERAVDLAGSVGSRFLEGVALLSSTALRARMGDIERSLGTFERVIRHWIQLADHTHQLTTLRNLVVLLQRADDPEGAAELIGAVERDDVPTYGEEAARIGAVLDWAIERLGPEEVEQLVADGRGRDVSAAAHWALDRIQLLEP
jgi:predicted ATPase/DNA-binding SARP family transcriptional activator